MKTGFHKYLTVFRKQRGYTQAELANKLGISRSTYANYESGNRSPDFETLERISDILNCTLDELFGRQREPETGNYKNPCREYSDMVCEATAPYRAEKGRSLRRSKRKLLIGAQDFRYLRERNAYYVDKTQFVEHFLDSWYQVTLVTRPRRFGKTLNMSMLAEFLDCTKDSKALFEGTKISRSEVIDEINQYPVVFLSFLNVRGDTPHEMIQQLAAALRGEYARYSPIIDEGRLTAEQKRVFEENYLCLCQNSAPEAKAGCLTHAIADLCQVLEIYYNKKVYLLIDEYDTPFIAANSGGYYDQVRGILAGMLSSALKGSRSLEKAVLTGIQRVAKENIFSGLNNLIVCTIADPDYDDCFGFTEEEVKELLAYCGIGFTAAVREMYDGYRIGKADVYNPWSVSCYAARRELQSYWVNTSENSILKDALGERGRSFAEDYDRLIGQGMVEAEVELSAAYYEKPGDAALWGLLINAGMLTITEKTDENRYRLRVPNQEVWKAFRELTSYYLQVEEEQISRMLYHLQKGEMEDFAEDYRQILLKLPSYHDLKSENSYHMMMLGMCAFMQRAYKVESNRESGDGRADLILYSKKPGYPSLILEFKYSKNTEQDLGELASGAICQVKEKKYDAGITGEVLYVGLAHCGKNVEIRWEEGKSNRK